MDLRKTLVVALPTALAAVASAQPVLITAPQTIAPGQATITPTAGGPAVNLATADITVSNTTLTIDGRCAIASLTLTGNSARVTHDANFSYDADPGPGVDIVRGLELTLTGDLTINSGARLTTTGAGYPAQTGPGAGHMGTTAYGSGGSYGGDGEDNSTIPSGPTYGSFTQPTDFGSGGGTYVNGASLGGAGGGCIRLIVGGNINLAASSSIIDADGDSASGGTSGSGGSIWISCNSLTGAGAIHANSANTVIDGGGGRISITAQSTSSFTGSIHANGTTTSGAGTVYLAIGNATPQLIFDNNGSTSPTRQSDPIVVTGDLITRNGAYIAQRAGLSTGMSVTVTGNLIIQAGSGFNLSGLGYGPGMGPGAGQMGTTAYGSGGSYGGDGEDNTGISSGPTYGSFTQPTDFGSGGGTYYNGQSPGGAGGGAIRLIVSGDINLAASTAIISADGTAGSGGTSGSGGSIWITCGSLSGSGAIHANSANTIIDGGGGRVSITTGSTSSFTGSIKANGTTTSGAGTIYMAVGSATPQLIFDNNGNTSPSRQSNPIVVTGNLITRGGAYLAHRDHQVGGLSITVNGDMSIEAGSGINVSGLGYPAGMGPGAGQMGTISYGSGGSYGGDGEDSASIASGPTYGSFTQPTDFGSGGGTYFNGQSVGGSGGGAIRLNVSGNLGFTSSTSIITADGAAGPGGTSGSGGSIWITAGSLSGAGTIHANSTNSNIDGGGGRVSITAGSISSFTGSIKANGTTTSGAGTVYMAIGSATPQLIFDNNANVAPTRQSNPIFVTGDLITRGGAYLAHRAGSTDGLAVTVTGNMSVEANSGIDVSGDGYPAATGPGAGQSGVTSYGSGGSYGGAGENSPDTSSGPTYGSDLMPTDLGSGGGTYFNGQSLGGAGGGAVRLAVGGTLSLASSTSIIQADGLAASGGTSGSGGSIWISCATLAGSGRVRAGSTNTSIDGGGGRVAVYACNITLPTTNITAPAGGPGAQAGTVHLAAVSASVSPAAACSGQEVVLHVIAAGDAAGIQWRHQGVPLTDGYTESGSLITGSMTPTLVISGATSADSGDYDAFVPGVCGGTTSNAATLFVTCCPDVNQDGVADQGDVDYLINVIAGGANTTGIDPDFNRDGVADQGDIDALINVVAGGQCP